MPAASSRPPMDRARGRCGARGAGLRCAWTRKPALSSSLWCDSTSTRLASAARTCEVATMDSAGSSWREGVPSSVSCSTNRQAGLQRSSVCSTRRTACASWALAGAWFATPRRMRAEAREVRSTMPDTTTLLEHLEHHFRRLLRRAKASADRVLVVRQPWFEKNYTADEAARFWTGAVGMPWRETVNAYYSLEVLNRLLGLVDARVAKVASALGVPHLNLRPVLTQGLRHYYDHDHFTPVGAAVVAQTVATALLARPSVTRTVRSRPALAVSASAPSPGSTSS